MPTRQVYLISNVVLQGTDVDDAEKLILRKPSDDEPFSALAFKIMADKFVGSLTFCRVYRFACLIHLSHHLSFLAGNFVLFISESSLSKEGRKTSSNIHALDCYSHFLPALHVLLEPRFEIIDSSEYTHLRNQRTIKLAQAFVNNYV